jgi:hypothetical protein
MRRPPNLLACLLLSSCVPANGVLIGPGSGDDDDDDSVSDRPLDVRAVGPASVLQPYSAPVRAQGWGGGITWALLTGSLPPGIEFGEDGTLSGTPTWLGTYTFTARGTLETGSISEGDVTVEVVPGDTELEVGYVRDQVNNMTEEEDLMKDAWLRIAGGGEGGMTEVTLDLGIYGSGPNGQQEGGFGDDIRVYDLPPGQFELALGSWTTPQEWDTDEPLEYVGDASFVAHGDTGRQTFTVTATAFPEVDELDSRVIVTPPDWCPLGEHDGGGWNPGQCS